MSNPLQQFYLDEGVREAVKSFLILCLKDEAVELTFNGQETRHIKQANDIIEKAFNKLEQQYGKKEKKQKENPAR